MLIFFILIIAQIIFLGIITMCLKKNNKSTENISNNYKTIGVLIPFRNEEQNLPEILNRLKNQTYSKTYTQIIFINDHSTDNSYKIVSSFIEKNKLENFTLVNLPEQQQGKKQALIYGLNFIKTDIIVHTDADTLLNKLWLNTIVNYFNKSDAGLVLMPVFYKSNKEISRLSESIQILETNLLAAVTKISAVCTGKPILANGANMAYIAELKDYFIDSYNKLSSGDDMFFLEYCNNKNIKIEYLDNENVYVYTKTENNFFNFILQRIRWSGKNSKLSNKHIKITGITVILINLLWVSIFFFNKIIILNALAFKVLSEFLTNYYIIHHFKLQKNVLIDTTVFSILYPFYIVMITILSFFVKPKWKGRVVR